MAKIERPRQLLVSQLQQLLYVERQLANDVLPMLIQEIQNGELKQGVTLHAAQTHDQVQRLHAAFESLGAEPSETKDPALDGLTKEHKQTVAKLGDPKLKDFAHADAVAKTEHLEIAAYSGAIVLAQKLALHQVASLLEETLAEEQSALEKAEQVGETVAQEAAAVGASS